jgi:hypothetical protein
MEVSMLDRLTAGRTDLVFDLLNQGHSATATDADGVSLLSWCAYYGTEATVTLLLDAGARVDVKDAQGDSPLWGSWYRRPASLLRLLCYGDFYIRPDYAGMRAHLQGEPEET